MRRSKICVVGLGTVGYPTAKYIAGKGFETHGYDIDDEKVLKVKRFSAHSDWNEVPACDAYVVCVNTEWDDGGPDVRPVRQSAKIISETSDGGEPLVSIESTVPVGTCRTLATDYGLRFVCHVPHRYWEGDVRNRGVKQLRVMGSLNGETTARAKRLYQSLGIPIFPVSSLEGAELVKAAENAHRFVQIAFVEEMKLICDQLGLPFEDIRNGMNTKWNVSLLEPRNGIGGTCLPKDIRYVLQKAGKAPLLEGAVEADRKYLEHIRRNNGGLALIPAVG